MTSSETSERTVPEIFFLNFSDCFTTKNVLALQKYSDEKKIITLKDLFA